MRFIVQYVAAATLVAGTAVFGADHREAPAVLADPAADINDIFAFVNPNDPGEFIVAATVHPRATEATRFSDAVSYRFFIDNGAGGQFEFVCTVDGGIRLSCLGSNGAVAAGPIETVLTGEGLRAFAGLREDPFFLDGAALGQTLATGVPAFTDPGVDSFAGFNTLALVLGIPIGDLTDGSPESQLTFFWAATDRRVETVGVNGSLSGPWIIVDEQGRPEAGQGFQFEVLESPLDPTNPPQFFSTFYGFVDGFQLWLAGNVDATTGSTQLTIPVSRFSGGDFVPAFDPDMVLGEPVGDLTLSFDDANSGSASFAPADGVDLPAFDERIARLATIQGLPASLPVRGGQVDRMGRAAVNTALIPSDLKDAYNFDDDPSTWVDDYAEAIAQSLAFTDSLDGIDGNLLTGNEAALAGVLADDRLLTRLDIAACDGGYLAVEAALVAGTEPVRCGGRTLDQDTVDLTLTVLVSGGEVPISDNVDANDVDSTLDVFPFFGEPQ